jgi:hypothetical protein
MFLRAVGRRLRARPAPNERFGTIVFAAAPQFRHRANSGHFFAKIRKGGRC